MALNMIYHNNVFQNFSEQFHIYSDSLQNTVMLYDAGVK